MDNSNSTKNKRIAKNTLLLYFRMLFLMLISLYTSRVVLNALGVEDYGIYNVVGGVVMMFSMLSGSLSAAISRFLTFELGKGDKENLDKVFSLSITIQLIIALAIILVAETIGLWFLNEKMIIPVNRISAANWCFQFSIVAFAVNLISVPYNAAIIAHERMSAFAYISILEGIGKLLIAWCIVVNPIDRLVFYGGMIALLAIVLRIIYGLYCKKYFGECSYHFVYDKDLLKQIFGFAGWNFIGSSASILRDQGGNILINLFFGPAVNAARGIATKVNTVITSFVQNFMVAMNPQIIKSYAEEDGEYLMTLIYNGARFSYYLLLLLSLPVLLNTQYLLTIWLGLIPNHTVNFVRLILVFALHESLANPLITAMLATGKIKKYQICAGGMNLMNLPISYVVLKMRYPPESVLIVAIMFSLIVQIVRLVLLKDMINLPIKDFFKKVYMNVIIVTLFASLLPVLMNRYFENSLLQFLSITVITVVWTLFVVILCGLKKEERTSLLQRVSVYCQRLS